MDFKPIRRTWRGVTFDSQLEADWCATFTAWGVAWEYHPGWMLLDNGDRYEPDFLLEDDIVFECKGDHNQRIDKPLRAASEFGLNVIIGRQGYVPPVNDCVHAGAVWEDKKWALFETNDGMLFKDTTEEQVSTPAYWSADYAYVNGLSGIRWFKAVGEDEAV